MTILSHMNPHAGAVAALLSEEHKHTRGMACPRSLVILSFSFTPRSGYYDTGNAMCISAPVLLPFFSASNSSVNT